MSGNLRRKLTEAAEKLKTEATEKLKTASSTIMQRADHERTIECAREATELNPHDSHVWVDYALALLLLRRREEAWNAFQQGMEISSGHLDSIKFRSSTQALQFIRMHEEYGDSAEAEEQFTLFANHSPLNPEGWCALGEFYIRHGRLTDASLSLINGLHEAEHETIYLTLGKVHALQGSMKQAKERAICAVEMNPTFFDAVMYIALFSNRLGDSENEEKALLHARSLLQKHPELQTKYEEMLRQISDTKVSIFWQEDMPLVKTAIEETLVNKSKAETPPAESVVKEKAKVRMRSIDAVLPAFDSEMELVPTPDHEILADSEIGLIPIPDDQAVPKEKTAFISEAERETPLESEMEKISITKTKPKLESKPKTKSKKEPTPKPEPEPMIEDVPAPSTKESGTRKSELKKATLDAPNDPNAWYNLGEYLRTENDLLDSEMALKRAIMIDPLHSDALQSLGMLLLATNRIEEGDIIFQRVAALDPASSDSWINLARHQLDSGDIQAAGASLKKALDSNSEDYEAWQLVALLQIKSGKIKDAEKAARRAISINESYKDGWKTLGQVLDTRGKKKGALEAFERVAQIDPDDSIAWSNIGVALAKNKNLDKALRAFQRAIDLDSTNLVAWRNISALYRRQGRTREADAANAKLLDLQRIKGNGNSH